jgi:hypothetical protein
MPAGGAWEAVEVVVIFPWFLLGCVSENLWVALDWASDALWDPLGCPSAIMLGCVSENLWVALVWASDALWDPFCCLSLWRLGW